MKFRNALFASASASALLCLPADAEEKFTLRMAHTYPADHFLWEQAGA